MRKIYVGILAVVFLSSFVGNLAFAEGSAGAQRKFNTWTVEGSKTSAKTKENVTNSSQASDSWKKQLGSKVEAKLKANQTVRPGASTVTKKTPVTSVTVGAKPVTNPTATVAKPNVKPNTTEAVKVNTTAAKTSLKKAVKNKKHKAKHQNKKEKNKPIVTNNNQKLRWEGYAKNGIKNLSGDAVVKEASKYKGVHYVFGGTTPKGFDCSGYVQYVFKRLNANLTRTADTQAKEGVFVTQRQLKPGDLVFFSTYEPGASHVGIYAGNGKFWNATSSRGVMLCGLQENYWRTRYYGARRVLVANGEPK